MFALNFLARFRAASASCDGPMSSAGVFIRSRTSEIAPTMAFTLVLSARAGHTRVGNLLDFLDL